MLFWGVGAMAQITLDTPIHFQIENATVAEALEQLADQQNLNIAFSDRFFDSDRSIQIDIAGQPLSEALRQILDGTPVVYRFENQQLILFRRKKPRPRQFTISGYIMEHASRERLIGVSVHHPSSGKWAMTNEFGFYSITLPEGEAELRFSYLGCEAKRERLSLRQSTRLDVQLQPAITLAEVIVIPATDSARLGTVASEGQLMPPNYVGVAPGVGGETDILSMATSLPGVQSGPDGFGGLYVRGGGAGQNLMLMDGVPVYNPSHLMGIFSVYNTDAIRSAQLLKGRFPARFGGRVSSVFDVRSKEGNQESWRGDIGLGLVSGKALLEGPILNKKGAVLVAGRRSHSNFLLDHVFRNSLFGNTEEYRFGFYDLNAKVHYSLTEKDRLFLSYYRGQDKYEGYSSEEAQGVEQKSETLLGWGNDIAALRWNHIWSHKLFSNIMLTFSDYRYRNTGFASFEDEMTEEEGGFIFNDRRNQIQDWGVNLDFDWMPNPEHTLRLGAGLTHHTLLPYTSSFDPNDDLVAELDSFSFDIFSALYEERHLNALELAVFIEDEIKMGEKGLVNAGLRASSFHGERGHFFNLEPRLSVEFKPLRYLAIHIAGSKMVQYLQQISFSGLSLPDDLWLPSSEEEPPLESWLFETGVSLSANGYDFSAEAYYKKMDNLLAPLSSTGIDIDEDFNVEGLAIGKGTSYGLEMMVQKHGKTGGWISYTLSQANRHFDDFNLGKRYAFQYDRRHAVNLFLYHQFNKNWQMSASWIFGTGNPKVLLIDSFAGDGLTPFPEFPELENNNNKNSERNNAYHRLDIGLTYQLKKKKLHHIFKIGAYNVYNKANPAFYNIGFDAFGDIYHRPVTLLNFTPSLYYQVRF